MTSEYLTHTVSFSRKRSDGNYGSQDATLFIQFDTPIGGDVADIIEIAADRFAAAKAAVLDQLGIPYHLDNGLVVEEVTVDSVATGARINQAFKPISEDEGQPVFGTGGGERDPQGVGPVPPYSPDTKDKSEKGMNLKWAKARYETHPGEFWDNREKKASGQFSEKSPDLSHKDTRIGIWLD